MAKDIEGNELKVDDWVYYARKRDHYANGELKKLKITSISYKNVIMGPFKSTKPESQIIKIK